MYIYIYTHTHTHTYVSVCVCVCVFCNRYFFIKDCSIFKTIDQ